MWLWLFGWFRNARMNFGAFWRCPGCNLAKHLWWHSPTWLCQWYLCSHQMPFFTNIRAKTSYLMLNPKRQQHQIKCFAKFNQFITSGHWVGFYIVIRLKVDYNPGRLGASGLWFDLPEELSVDKSGSSPQIRTWNSILFSCIDLLLLCVTTSWWIFPSWYRFPALGVDFTDFLFVNFVWLWERFWLGRD